MALAREKMSFIPVTFFKIVNKPHNMFKATVIMFITHSLNIAHKDMTLKLKSYLKPFVGGSGSTHKRSAPAQSVCNTGCDNAAISNIQGYF